MSRHRLYYTAPALESLEAIVEDLKQIGVGFNDYQVMSNDIDGVKRHHLHSISPSSQYDFWHLGARGALAGFFGGLIFALGLAVVQPFEMQMSLFMFSSIILIITCFGMWVGGMAGLGADSYLIEPYQKELDQGKHLLMIDVEEHHEPQVKEIMQLKHSEAIFKDSSSAWANPFDGLKFWQWLQS